MHKMPERPPRDYSIHPYRLSESTINTLILCERRFELDRLVLNQEITNKGRSMSPENVRGLSYGTGVQAYMLTGDMDYAVYEAWLAYWPKLEDPPKTFQSRVLNNLIQSKGRLDKLREEYDVAIFNDEAAIELSFRLNLDDKWYFVGYIDLVLQHKTTKAYGVLEVKTTWNWRQDLQPMWKYSGQALGYSIILDQIAGAEQSAFDTPYLVCQELKDNFIPAIHVFPFKKTLQDRFKWFLTLGEDLKRLNTMMELKHFPQRSGGCLAYGKVCPHYDFCGMSGDRYREPGEDKNVYQFTYNLDEVIIDHVRRIKKV